MHGVSGGSLSRVILADFFVPDKFLPLLLTDFTCLVHGQHG
jgi:hypothetical protein